MDYNKLTKEEIINLLEERGLSYDSSNEQSVLSKILIDNDNTKNNTSKEVDKIGAKFSIINGWIGIVILPLVMILTGLLAGIPFWIDENITWAGDNIASVDAMISFWVCLAIIFILLIGLIGSIICIISNKRFLKGKDNRKMAAWLGIIFGGIFGGVALLKDQPYGKLKKQIEKENTQSKDNVEQKENVQPTTESVEQKENVQPTENVEQKENVKTTTGNINTEE